MIENLIKRYSKEDNNLNNYVDGLDLHGLVNFYLKCSSRLYFRKYNNLMNDILTMLYEKIMSKLQTTSLIEVMEEYFNVFNESLNNEDSIEAIKNVINVRKYNLEDNFYIDYESKKRDMNRDEFIENYNKSIEVYEEECLYLKSVLDYIDKLQTTMFEYIEQDINNLTETERFLYLVKVNDIIEENSLEITRRNDIRKNKRAIDIESKMKDISTFEIFTMLDTSTLKNKNYVYKSFKGILKEKGMNK